MSTVPCAPWNNIESKQQRGSLESRISILHYIACYDRDRPAGPPAPPIMITVVSRELQALDFPFRPAWPWKRPLAALSGVRLWQSNLPSRDDHSIVPSLPQVGLNVESVMIVISQASYEVQKGTYTLKWDRSRRDSVLLKGEKNGWYER